MHSMRFMFSQALSLNSKRRLICKVRPNENHHICKHRREHVTPCSNMFQTASAKAPTDRRTVLERGRGANGQANGCAGGRRRYCHIPHNPNLRIPSLRNPSVHVGLSIVAPSSFSRKGLPLFKSVPRTPACAIGTNI